MIFFLLQFNEVYFCFFVVVLFLRVSLWLFFLELNQVAFEGFNEGVLGVQ